MKYVVLILALGAGGAVQAEVCNHRSIYQQSRELERTAFLLENKTQDAAAYAPIVDLSFQLQSEVNRIAADARKQASCEQMEKAFRELVMMPFVRIRDHHARIQGMSPSAEVSRHYTDFERAYTAFITAASAGKFFSTEGIACQSANGRTACPSQGQIALVEWYQALPGSSPCVRGRTFGFDGKNLWVTEGCKAVFLVTFRR